MKYKVGDKVRVRKDLKVGERYGSDVFIVDMLPMLGKVVTINEVFEQTNKFWIEELPCWAWTPEMVEPITKDKIIFRDKATILFKDGKKYVTKCNAEDTYDREKGVLLALAKAHGYSYRDIEKMVAEAEIQGKKIKEVERVARVGEYIKLKRNTYSFNEIGDILKVDVAGNYVVGVYNENQLRETDVPSWASNTIWNYLPREYVVLENYIPRGSKR